MTDKKEEKLIEYQEIKDKIDEHLKHEKKNKEIILYIQELKKKARIEKFL